MQCRILHFTFLIFNSLSLSLLMLRIFANHAHNAFPMYYFALIANFLDRRTDFHFFIPQLSLVISYWLLAKSQ
jgi:antibiotic biosynthesis monooxygenase (ABM) superfamily enzyme